MGVYFMSFLSPYTQGLPIFRFQNRSTGSEPGSLRTEFVQQRLGVLQVGGVEALGEPVVDLGEHRAGFVATIRVAQQSCEADRRAQLERPRFLLPRDFDRLPKGSLRCRCGGRIAKQRERAVETVHLGFVPAFAGALYQAKRFSQQSDRLVHRLELGADLGGYGEKIWQEESIAGSTPISKGLSHLRQVGLARRRILLRPSKQDRRHADPLRETMLDGNGDRILGVLCGCGSVAEA